jgi:Flp pilus assembly protein TadG
MERGQALVEFAFVMPLLLLFILLVVDFGIALDRREIIQHAVREGARRGAVGDDPITIRDVTHRQSKGTLGDSDIDVCYVDKNHNAVVGDAGDSVRVSGNYSYKFTVSMFGLGAPTIDMSPSAEERLESEVFSAPPCSTGD